jgi:xanthine dehydrogenase FAD-binding subunit
LNHLVADLLYCYFVDSPLARFRVKIIQLGSSVAVGFLCGGVGPIRLPVEKCRRSYSGCKDNRRSMTIWKSYHLAESVQDALQALAGSPGPACPIAGGTDLLLDIQQGRHPPIHTLVDVTAVPEMTALEIRQGRLNVGAAVPLNHIVASTLVQEHAQALVEACALIGGPQVRNTATLGGNVAHALPAADGTIALLAMDAQAEVATLEGCRSLPLSALFLGPGESAIDPRRELLVGFSLPMKIPGEGSAFRRVMRPQGVAIAILNMAAWVQRGRDEQGRETIAGLRLSVGPAGSTPLRARKMEEALLGKPMADELRAVALAALLSESRFRTSPHRATSEYRLSMAKVLLEDVLLTAWNRAGATVAENNP